MTSADTFLAGLPPARPGDPARVAAHNRDTRTWLVALDDDPTGTQTSWGTPVLTRWEPHDLDALAAAPPPATFLLTNSRALDECDAVAIVEKAGVAAAAAADHAEVHLRLVSRSDSTLRGHFPAETDALDRAAGPFDLLLVVPAFPEAGRITVDSTHLVRRGDHLVPLADTEYARDEVFRSITSDLRAWTAGRTNRDPSTVAAIPLAALREGGPDRVTQMLTVAASDGRPVVVADAADPADLDVLALAVQAAEAEGVRLLARSGPSFVRARAGLPSRGPLAPHEVVPQAAPRNGLLVVGSHTALTTNQLAHARQVHPIATVELDVVAVLNDDASRRREVMRCTAAVDRALARTTTALVTSRNRVGGHRLEGSRRVSAAVVEVVRGVEAAQPLRYVLAKGGITAADVAVGALGMRRATALGTLLPGLVPVWRRDDGGVPLVVFPGNVGDTDSLTRVLTILEASTPC